MRVDADDTIDNSWVMSQNNLTSPKSHFHEAIFKTPDSISNFSERKLTHRMDDDERVETIFFRSIDSEQPIIAGGRVSGSGNASVDISWGGSEGTQVDVKVDAEIHNDKGDNLGVTYTRDNDGQSRATVDGGSSKSETSSKDR